MSHPYETPQFERRLADLDALFGDGRFVGGWDSRPLLIVAEGAPGPRLATALSTRGARSILENGAYRVYFLAPRPPPGRSASTVSMTAPVVNSE